MLDSDRFWFKVFVVAVCVIAFAMLAMAFSLDSIDQQLEALR